MTKIMKQITLITTCVVILIITLTRPVRAADVFADAATTPAFMRDIHVVSAGGYRVGGANTSDGQNTGMSYDYLFVASNIWNNEHNQVLGGIQFGRREFDHKLALPDGFDMPDRLDNASAALLYKHITSGDWSISQGIRYTRSWTDSPSMTVRDTFDLVGLAVISREPGVAWAFGYIYTQTESTKDRVYPVIEYINNAHDRWSFTLGYPVLNFAFSPHPDWMLSGGGISYKVTEQNIARLSYAGDNWAYRLEGPEVKPVSYTAQRVGLDWTYLYHIDHRTVVVLNASLGWEFKRKLGSDNKDNKLSMDDAAVMGFNASLSF